MNDVTTNLSDVSENHPDFHSKERSIQNTLKEGVDTLLSKLEHPTVRDLPIRSMYGRPTPENSVDLYLQLVAALEEDGTDGAINLLREMILPSTGDIDDSIELAITPLPDDQQDLYLHFCQVLRHEGISVEEFNPFYSFNSIGFGRPSKIFLAKNLSSRHKLFTLLHEYAHELLLGKDSGDNPRNWSLEIQECHAETVSYLVAYCFGLQNPDSALYLRHWGISIERVLEELPVIIRTAESIIQKATEQE